MTNTLTRRSMLGHSAVALIGGAGLALAVPDIEAGATAAHDPMLAFLNEWEGMERVAESIPAKDDDWVARYLVPLDQRVADGDVPNATTAEGAAAALRRALHYDDMPNIGANLVKSALAYLESRPA